VRGRDAKVLTMAIRIGRSLLWDQRELLEPDRPKCAADKDFLRRSAAGLGTASCVGHRIGPDQPKA
jgi:hypothetical protein